jgi:hypothetical protein
VGEYRLRAVYQLDAGDVRRFEAFTQEQHGLANLVPERFVQDQKVKIDGTRLAVAIGCPIAPLRCDRESE